MSRPYRLHTMKQLEILYESNLDNLEILEALEIELNLRTTKAAVDLQDRILKQLDKLTQSGDSRSTPSAPSTVALTPAATVAPPKLATTAAATARSAAPPAVAEPAATMALEEAERILGVRNDAPWATVESARFTKVAPSSPDALAGLKKTEAAKRVADAKAANAAYLTLLSFRCLVF
ncbi:hypothetical protein D8B25_18220 [Verminephrobacter aporrectodeae subsp. tuberculatae]|nr:hypothetical protein [Verminephrobacter aporrectodeae subsp. tuberculatae]MCW8204657.1 hypothetical protein [Verminephrobacter aporrectodeae subsp. tuberculatae]